MYDIKKIPSVGYWALVPCAGQGHRMKGEVPKQYLKIKGKTLIEHTLTTLLEFVPSFKKIIVMVNEKDTYWKSMKIFKNSGILVITGGLERFNSVYKGLEVLQQDLAVASEDWIVVHDAVRPCMRLSDLNRLVEKISSYDVGGLLGIPVVDTIKRVINQDAVVDTLDRSALWRALTPQVFRFQVLIDSMRQVFEECAIVTDESSAVEYAGYQPLIVKGRSDNIKITVPGDLRLASFYIRQLESNMTAVS